MTFLKNKFLQVNKWPAEYGDLQVGYEDINTE